jgi:hypothetical protein
MFWFANVKDFVPESEEEATATREFQVSSEEFALQTVVLWTVPVLYAQHICVKCSEVMIDSTCWVGVLQPDGVSMAKAMGAGVRRTISDHLIYACTTVQADHLEAVYGSAAHPPLAPHLLPPVHSRPTLSGNSRC